MATSTAALGKVRVEHLGWWIPAPTVAFFPSPFTHTYTQVEMQRRKEQPMPRGWGVDESGMVSPSSLTTGWKPHNHSYLQETTDPGAVLDGGGLMPLGGSEITGRSLDAALLPSLTHTCTHLHIQLATRAMGWQ